MKINEIKTRISEIENEIKNNYKILENLIPEDACITYEDLKDYAPLSFDDVYSMYSDNCANGVYEVIYYDHAIDFLKENDSSLMQSLEIADEYGYKLDNINSELLASLLLERLISDDLYKCETKINNVCYVLANLNDEKERLEEELLNAEYLN